MSQKKMTTRIVFSVLVVFLLAFAANLALSYLHIPEIAFIGSEVFANTGNAPLTIRLGATPPDVGIDLFNGVITPKNVTLLVPAGALAAYEPLPVDTVTPNWTNGFRGMGWAGGSDLGGTANDNIHLSFQTY